MRFNHPIVGTNREDESEGWAVNCQDVLEVPRSRGFEAGKLESAGPRVRQSRSNLTEIHGILCHSRKRTRASPLGGFLINLR